MTDLEYFETAAHDFGAEDRKNGKPMLVRRSFLAMMLELCPNKKDETVVRENSLKLYGLYWEGYNR